MNIKITAKNLTDICGATSSVASSMVEPIQKAMDKYSISANANRVAAFLSNIGVESAGLTLKRENMNYSAARLAVVWPSRYAVDPKASQKVPNALANKLAGNPVAIGNNVYASRLGNGDESSGDGYKYRGGSFIQTTGKTNYQAAFKRMGLPADSDPDLLSSNPEYAAEAAASFFASSGCNQLADAGSISAVIQKINGAPPSDVNHGPLRKTRYFSGVKALS